jgi:hypothetical protein
MVAQTQITLVMKTKLRMRVYTIGNMVYTVDIASAISVSLDTTHFSFTDIKGEYIQLPISFLDKIELE